MYIAQTTQYILPMRQDTQSVTIPNVSLLAGLRMRLKVIDYQDVRRDFDTGVPTKYNTNFHTKEDAPDLPIPSNKPYSFDRWLPLILRSRGLQPSALQIVSLTRTQVSVLNQAARASIHTRVLNRAYAEDLEDDVYPAFNQLVFPPEGLFMRLGACSAKDGVQMTPGKASLHSVDEIVLLLSTSQRAWGSLTNIMNSEASEAQIYFLPYDARMKTEAEYRVFCMPESLRITAVSQYRWHKPWVFSDRSGDEMSALAGEILKGIEDVLSDIIGELQDEGENDLDDLLRTQGFTFDILYDEKTRLAALIELNTFGVRSACGSCLFQWVNDRELLYGNEPGGVEFRITM